MFIDIHSHLDHPFFADTVAEVVQKAREAGVRHIITNGITPETNRKCLELSKKYDIIECGMGVYPRDSLQKEKEQGEPIEIEEFDISQEIAFMREQAKEIVAISEVGLDFVHGDSKLQREDFQRMIDLSLELDKPVVVHSRKAELACIEMLEKSNAKKVVMHCFCGKKKLVKRIQENGWSCSIPTTVVRATQFQEMVELLPLQQLFCETDSPYLSPFKDKQNQPSFVIESYKQIARIKGLEIEEVAKAIYANYQRLFL